MRIMTGLKNTKVQTLYTQPLQM